MFSRLLRSPNFSLLLRRFLATTTTDSVSVYPQSLLNVPLTHVTVLDNGMRVASQHAHSETCTVGIWIDSGSRYETAKNNGVAHFLEHIIFKGTKRRTQKALEMEIENMGGHLNAYTAREQTVYYATVFKKDLARAVDILADILQCSNLDEQAIDRERGVILREMEEVEKQNEEVIFDHLHSIAYQGTGLGRTILGPVENIKSIQRADLLEYIQRNYTAPRMILAAAGDIEHKELVKLAETAFASLPKESPFGPVTTETAEFTGSEVRIRNDEMDRVNIAACVEGVGWTHPDYFPLLVAQSIVGSWDRGLGAGGNVSSRLAQNLAKHALVDSFMSFNTCYKDTGLFGLYFVTPDRIRLDDVFYFLVQEWIRLSVGIAEHEVERAKNQLKTSILLQLDGTTAICEDIGRQMLTYGRHMTPYEIDARIEAVTVKDVKAVASRYIYDRDLAIAAMGPIEAMPDYTRIRANMSWVRV
jgi:mitochondrial-processing peptidase subunit beta